MAKVKRELFWIDNEKFIKWLYDGHWYRVQGINMPRIEFTVFDTRERRLVEKQGRVPHDCDPTLELMIKRGAKVVTVHDF